MKIGLIVLIPMIAGVATGLTLTHSSLSQVEEQFQVFHQGEEDELLEFSADPVAEVVGADSFDFGTLARNESRDHKFKIKSAGETPLDISFLTASCGLCVQTDFEHASVIEGETFEIPVRFSTKKPEPHFHEFLEIRTNDPHNSVIRFTITGNVVERIRLSREQLNLSDISSGQSHTVKFQIYGYHSERLEITDYDWANPSTAELFDVEFRKIDPPQHEEALEPLAAIEAVATIKPGLPVGSLNQTLQMDILADEPVELAMPVAGNVVSDVSVLGGPKFLRSQNALRLGTIDRDEGVKATLRVLVKGPMREEIELQVGAVDPEDGLRAMIGEPREARGGAVYLYPLTIEVPKGTRPMHRLGSAQGEAGEIVLETNHPSAKQVVVSVRFAVQ